MHEKFSRPNVPTLILCGSLESEMPPLASSWILYWCGTLQADAICRRTPKPNGNSRELLHAPYSYDMDVVDFLHYANPPIWAGVKPAILCGQDRDKQDLQYPAGVL
ncbi:hypothetical protein TNCV_2847051 [Trichonephila clavipes]|nr:hypothetical protein TNCV_2847051 [Trichonephila clavipes]